MKEGAFREDLFNRVNVFTIAIPPLRERVEDIPALAWAFVEESSRVFGKRIAAIADRSAAIPLAGNIREPRNVIVTHDDPRHELHGDAERSLRPVRAILSPKHPPRRRANSAHDVGAGKLRVARSWNQRRRHDA